MLHQRFHSPSQPSRPFWKTPEASQTVLATFCGAKLLSLDTAMLQFAGDISKKTGQWLELGVASGQSICFLAEHFPDRIIFGFDSFEGLPEDWIRQDRVWLKGAYSQNSLPQVPKNVRLVQGWFQDTLPRFIKEHPEPIAFIHIDCDLYSSTKQSLEILTNLLVPGTVVLFDEFYNYPGSQDHEAKAFWEFLKIRHLSARALAFNALHEQALFELIDILT